MSLMVACCFVVKLLVILFYFCVALGKLFGLKLSIFFLNESKFLNYCHLNICSFGPKTEKFL